MRRNRPQPTAWEGLKIIHPNAAGLDIGSAEIWAAVSPESTSEPVRRFGTYTPDLHALAEWLKACGVDTVAMEATGVYWIPVYEVLEARGFEVYVVNARHIKNVPGRKSDVLDCQWIQGLHSVGLLRGSFRPEAEIAALRAYLRHRAERLDQVRAAVAAGARTARDVVERVYADVPREVWPAAELSVRAQLQYLGTAGGGAAGAEGGHS